MGNYLYLLIFPKENRYEVYKTKKDITEIGINLTLPGQEYFVKKVKRNQEIILFGRKVKIK